MGIDPIEYRPWQGERAGLVRRLWTITWTVFRSKLRSKAVLILLVLGVLLVHAIPIMIDVMTPHDDVSSDLMFGEEEVYLEPGNSTVIIDGELFLEGEPLVTGDFALNGSVSYFGYITIRGTVVGAGTLTGNGESVVIDNLTVEGKVKVNGTIRVYGYLYGNGTLLGDGTVTGNGTIHEEHDLIRREERFGGYMTNGLFTLFTMILAAIVVSDAISSDLADSSFVLYFSRPLRTIDYLAGKFLGLLMVMSLFCLLPPIIYVIAMTGTMSGDDYGEAGRVLGATFASGLFTAVFFLPLGLLISSMTKRRAYAGVGTFMSLFVLSIVSGIFAIFDANWLAANPFVMLLHAYQRFFGITMAGGVTPELHTLVVASLIVVPIIIVYTRVHRLEVGK